MMKWIHQNKHSITIVFLVIAAAFAISGVGVDILHNGGRNQYAAKVGDKEFSFADVSRAQRQVEAQYRRMLGPNFNEIAKSFNLNIAQQAIDTLVDGHLLEQKASDLGLAVSSEQLQEYIVQSFAGMSGTGTGFSPQAYAAFLRENGFTSQQYENYLRSNLVQSAYVGIISDSTYPSLQEARKALERSETEYSVVSANISSDKLISEVKDPTPEELTKYFESNATEYELPQRVSYDYVVLTPEQFAKDVPVQEQDIEMAYSENKSKYTTPEKAKVRSIKILYPKSSEPVKMSEVKEKALKAHSEALAGKAFESLVVQYSDDLPSKATGGSIGWVSPGTKSEAFDQAVFKLKAAGIADLIEEDFGFEIAKVEEYTPSAEKSLADVKPEIEKALRQTEAPAYASAKAHELESKFKGSDKSLSEIAKENSLVAASSNGALEQGKDPETQLSGLSAAVIQEAASGQTGLVVVELSDKSVLVNIKELKPAEIPSIEEIKTKVTADFKKAAAEKLAASKAQELLQAASASNLKDAASKLKVALSTPQTIKRSNPQGSTGALKNPEAREAVFKVSQDGAVLTQTFPIEDGFSILAVDSIKVPDFSSKQEKVKEFRSQAAKQLARTALDSNLAHFKSVAKVDIDQTLLVQ